MSQSFSTSSVGGLRQQSYGHRKKHKKIRQKTQVPESQGIIKTEEQTQKVPVSSISSSISSSAPTSPTALPAKQPTVQATTSVVATPFVVPTSEKNPISTDWEVVELAQNPAKPVPKPRSIFNFWSTEPVLKQN